MQCVRDARVIRLSENGRIGDLASSFSDSQRRQPAARDSGRKRKTEMGVWRVDLTDFLFYFCKF
jgi:hypothetical protein